jgi:hypothetical protein
LLNKNENFSDFFYQEYIQFYFKKEKKKLINKKKELENKKTEENKKID